MAATTSRHNHHHHHQRSLSSSRTFCSSSISSSSFHRSSSPTRINMYGSSSSLSSSSSSSSVKFSSTSPAKSITVKKKTCTCSPTTHPGSFRCNFHKSLESKRQNHKHNTTSFCSNRLNMRRSAMSNSLVRIGTVEGGEWEKRALASLIRPSSHHLRRRSDFRPRMSRLSVMSKSGDDDNRRC